MTKDEGRTWLIELTQSITCQLKQNREDITSVWRELRTAKECHIACREEILSEIAKIDKRVEVVVVRIGIYVAICTFVLTILLQFAIKHWGN